MVTIKQADFALRASLIIACVSWAVQRFPSAGELAVADGVVPPIPEDMRPVPELEEGDEDMKLVSHIGDPWILSDADGDGMVRGEEISTLIKCFTTIEHRSLTKEEIDVFLSAVDQDGDRAVAHHEYLRMKRSLDNLADFDANDDGLLTDDEFNTMERTLNKREADAARSRSRGRSSSSVKL